MPTEEQMTKAVEALSARLASQKGWIDVSCILTTQGLLVTLPWSEIAYMAIEEALCLPELNDGGESGE